MKSKIQFKSHGHTLQGKFYSSSNESLTSPTVLLLPGFPGNEEDVLGLGEDLSAGGVNTLTFNYRGTHRSQGEYSLKNTQEDIRAAFDYLTDGKTASDYRINAERIALGGWSYGGGMALTYAANNPPVKQVFSIAGTDHGQFARDYLGDLAFAKELDEVFESLKQPAGPVNYDGKTAIREELIKNPDTYDLTSRAADFPGRDILLIGAWDDLNVSVEDHILPLYRALKNAGIERVTIKAIQDDHAFEQTRIQLAKIILNWLDIVFTT